MTKFSALFCWDIQSKKTSAKTSALNSHDPAQQNWRNFREKLHDEVLQGDPRQLSRLNMKMLCWFCFARLLHLRFDRGWASVRPSRKQSQPPSYFAALLFNRIVAVAVPAPPPRIPISNHSHILPISFGNYASNLVCHRSENPHWPLLAPLYWSGKISQNLEQI